MRSTWPFMMVSLLLLLPPLELSSISSGQLTADSFISVISAKLVALWGTARLFFCFCLPFGHLRPPQYWNCDSAPPLCHLVSPPTPPPLLFLDKLLYEITHCTHNQPRPRGRALRCHSHQPNTPLLLRRAIWHYGVQLVINICAFSKVKVIAWFTIFHIFRLQGRERERVSAWVVAALCYLRNQTEKIFSVKRWFLNHPEVLHRTNTLERVVRKRNVTADQTISLFFILQLTYLDMHFCNYSFNLKWFYLCLYTKMANKKHKRFTLLFRVRVGGCIKVYGHIKSGAPESNRSALSSRRVFCPTGK